MKLRDIMEMDEQQKELQRNYCYLILENIIKKFFMTYKIIVKYTQRQNY